MQILGNRVLVERAEEEKKEGFQTVEIQDSFLYKGRVEQIGTDIAPFWDGTAIVQPALVKGVTIYFAKYSPHTQEIDVEGKKMKVVRLDDIIAVE
jgi:co-chaperonin GroES (HSP10)